MLNTIKLKMKKHYIKTLINVYLFCRTKQSRRLEESVERLRGMGLVQRQQGFPPHQEWTPKLRSQDLRQEWQQ